MSKLGFLSVTVLSTFIFLFVLTMPVMSMTADTPSMTAPSPAPQMADKASIANETIVKVVNDPKHGKILTDNKGMTLYTFTKDTGNISACTDQCAKLWPPLVISSGEKPALEAGQSGNLGVIERADKTLQVTFNGLPLYHYSGDKKAGDVNGQGFKNLWFTVTPQMTSPAK